MSDVYSPVLGVALAFAVGSSVCLVSGRLSRSAHLLRLAPVGAVLSLLSLAIALASHVALGHPPGSERALGPIGFVAAHPMAAFVAVAAVTLLILGRRRRGARPPAAPGAPPPP